MVEHIFNSNTQESETGTLGVRDQPDLHSEFRATGMHTEAFASKSLSSINGYTEVKTFP